MDEKQLKAELAGPNSQAGRIADLMQRHPALIASVFQALANKSARVKFGCAKSIVILSETNPDLLRHSTEAIFELLGSENRILKWNAIAMLGNLAAAGQIVPIGKALRKLDEILACGELIAANHAIAALGKIGRAFPQEQVKITARLLGIERARLETDECRNIAVGKCIAAMAMYLSHDRVSEDVLEFARRQTSNTRRATAEKAKSFLRKYDKFQSAGSSVGASGEAAKV